MCTPKDRILTSLHDGTPILMRPIVPDDKNGLREGLRRLSPRSRYQRFLTPLKELSEKTLRHFTEIDYKNHMAWAAFDLSPLQQSGVGVARYVRHEARPTVAEIAVTVIDSHQRLGLGTKLLAVLSQSAAANGISSFEGDVLMDNAGMLKLLQRLGADLKIGGTGLFRFTVPIRRDPTSAQTGAVAWRNARTPDRVES